MWNRVDCHSPFDLRCARLFRTRLTSVGQHRQNPSAEEFMRRIASLSIILFLTAIVFAQSDVVAPNENLVAEGIPKIPASLAESVGRYSEFRNGFFESWNPVKREMLIGTRFGDTNQVHRVLFPGGARTQLTFFPDRVSGAAYQPVDGESFLFGKDVG